MTNNSPERDAIVGDVGLHARLPGFRRHKPENAFQMIGQTAI